MPNATLNGVAFDGEVGAAPSFATGYLAPATITRQPTKVGTVLEAANGARNLVLRNTSLKGTWALEWAGAPEGTRAQVYALYALTTTFSATFLGATRTVQCEPGDYEESVEFTMPGAVDYFSIKLTVREP